MTWLKLSDDFSDQTRDLSDAAFRTHVEGLLWAMRRETGGRLGKRDVDRFAESEQADTAVRELVDQGFWNQATAGFRVLHHMEHQPEPDLIEKKRKNNADRIRRWRRKRAGLDDD